MKRTLKEPAAHLPYSLHDMHVTGMAACGDTLALAFENGYVRVGDPCEQVGGELRFSGVDWDFCYAYTLNFSGNEGPFRGRKYFLANFIAEHPSLNFEIVDETYGYCRAKYDGYILVGTHLKECSIEIYHAGGMEYVTEE